MSYSGFVIDGVHLQCLKTLFRFGSLDFPLPRVLSKCCTSFLNLYAGTFPDPWGVPQGPGLALGWLTKYRLFGLLRFQMCSTKARSAVSGLTKLNTTQRFHGPIDPKVIMQPLNAHYWLNTHHCNDSPGHCFQALATLIRAEIAQRTPLGEMRRCSMAG